MTDRDTMRVLVSRSTASRLSRRGFLGGALASGLGAGLLTACGSDSGGGGGGDAGSLSIFTWGDYNDPGVLETFTADEGTELVIDSYSSNEEMIAKLVAAGGTSGYDIVVPTGTFIPQMSENGLLEELDLDRLAGFANLQDEFVDQAWDPGNRYSVCKAWGTTGFVYDTTVIARPLTTWADFLDAAQNEAAGSVSLLDDPKEIVAIALFAAGVDPNTEDEAELAAAEQVLLSQLAPNVSTFDSYPGSGAIAQASSALLQSWNGDTRLGILESDEPERWQWVLPTDGSNLWMDNWSIVSGAENVDAAYAFIDYLLQPDVSLAELSYIGYHTGIQDIQAAAEEAGEERLDLVFFSDEQLAGMTALTVNDAQQQIVDIVGNLKAAAGA